MVETNDDDTSPLSPASLLSFDTEAAKQQYAAVHEGDEEREKLRELTTQKRMVLEQTLANTTVLVTTPVKLRLSLTDSYVAQFSLS